MHLHFLGAAQTVTGSAYLLETAKQRFLIDAGLSQGSHKSERRNTRPLQFHPRHLDGIILTHAHADHSGLVPRLVAEGFRGPIYATPPTIDLCRILLADSGTIQEEDARYENKWRRRYGKDLVTPLYTKQQAEQAMRYFERLPYGKRISLGRNVKLTFHDAGHILGSAIVELEVEGSRMVFSGDLGKSNTPLLRDPARISQADYLIVESTYGDRLHGDPAQRLSQLVQVVSQAQGPIIIPAFAIERTQELLWDLADLMREGRIPEIPIYLDSPMAISASGVFEKHVKCLAPDIQARIRRGESPFEMPNLHIIREASESRALNGVQGPCIIISASGMCEGGRVKHHLFHHLPKPETTVLFVGYQAERTLGRRLRDGATEVSLFGETVKVRATIHSIDAYSAHADAKGLLDWVGNIIEPPALTFVTHGEQRASEALANALTDRYGLLTEIPRVGDVYEITPVAEPALGRLALKGELA